MFVEYSGKLLRLASLVLWQQAAQAELLQKAHATSGANAHSAVL